MKKKRNLKLFNHWIAEVREIALGKVYHADEEDDNGEVIMMNKTDLKWVFSKETMSEYFDDGMTPQEAFDEEVGNWE